MFIGSKTDKFLPILGGILIAVIISMFIVNYLGLNISDTNGARNLNRYAVFEGMHCNDKLKEPNTSLIIDEDEDKHEDEEN
jgi:hypothetical protein